MRFQILSGCGHRAAIGYLVLLLTGCLSADSVLASEPDYMTHKGPRVESAAEVDAPIDGLGKPQAPKPSADKVDPAPTSSFLGDSTLDFNFRTYYLERNRDEGADSLAWAIGGALEYRSGLWRDRIGIGATLYTSQPLYAPDQKPGTGLLAPVQDGYTVLGESYVIVKPFGNSLLRLFRQGLTLPYINKHDSRMTPITFEAYLLLDNTSKRFNYVLGYVDKIKKRTATTFQPMSEAAGAEGTKYGVSMIGGRYNFSENARIGAIDYYGYNTFNTFYVEATGHRELGKDLELRLSGQYTNQQNVGDALIGDLDTDQFGIKLDASLAGATLTLAYTRTGNNSGIQKPWGGSPSYNSVIVEDFDRAGEDAWRVGAAYDFARVGLKDVSGFVNYTVGDTPDSGDNASADEDELDFTLDWKPKNGKLDGLWLRARVALINASGPDAVDMGDYRLILNYDFSIR